MSEFLDRDRAVGLDREMDAVDLVVGIPSYREADSIGHVVEQAARGLRQHFGELDGLIVNVDNASPDGTREAFLEADALDVPRVYLSTPEGLAGKGRNFHNLFSLVRTTSARAVVVLDADLISVSPEWIRRFVEPVLDGYDYVTPLYARHPYDGTITNHICYPLLYGLCGVDLRQPIGGDFAFAPWLAGRWLAASWSESACEYGIDITMTLRAVFAQARVGQVPLGAKVHKPSAPKLGRMFLQVVDSLFGLLTAHRAAWDRPDERPAATVERIGEPVHEEPQELDFDVSKMAATAEAAHREHGAKLATFLEPETLAAVDGALGAGDGAPGLGPELWIDCVYQALGGYAAGHRREAVEGLKPLYLARVLEFVRATEALPYETAEELIREQADRFRACRAEARQRLSRAV